MSSAVLSGLLSESITGTEAAASGPGSVVPP
jgi:hypothetical protein